MAHEPIDTLGKATRHKMLVKAECSCGNVRYCRSADLMMVYGGGVDPLKLKFDCSRCKPQIKITLLEVASRTPSQTVDDPQANEGSGRQESTGTQRGSEGDLEWAARSND